MTSENKPLRVAMLAPISWRVPPVSYGPWEQVVYNLTQELVALGHHVTLFSACGARTDAEQVETVPYPLDDWPQVERSRPRRYDPATGYLEGPPDTRVWEQKHIAACMEAAAAGRFDLVHSTSMYTLWLSPGLSVVRWSHLYMERPGRGGTTHCFWNTAIALSSRCPRPSGSYARN